MCLDLSGGILFLCHRFLPNNEVKGVVGDISVLGEVRVELQLIDSVPVAVHTVAPVLVVDWLVFALTAGKLVLEDQLLVCRGTRLAFIDKRRWCCCSLGDGSRRRSGHAR